MRAEPPLLLIAEGRRARPRRYTTPRPLEMTLHLAVADLLRRCCLPTWQWTHFPSGEARDVRVGAKLKRMGLQRGWPDFVLIRPARGSARGLPHFLELKRLGEDLTDEQDAFRLWCDTNAVPFAIAYTIEDAIAILTNWRCLRIGQRAAIAQSSTTGGAI